MSDSDAYCGYPAPKTFIDVLIVVFILSSFFTVMQNFIKYLISCGAKSGLHKKTVDLLV